MKRRITKRALKFARFRKLSLLRWISAKEEAAEVSSDVTVVPCVDPEGGLTSTEVSVVSDNVLHVGPVSDISYVTDVESDGLNNPSHASEMMLDDGSPRKKRSKLSLDGVDAESVVTCVSDDISDGAEDDVPAFACREERD